MKNEPLRNIPAIEITDSDQTAITLNLTISALIKERPTIRIGIWGVKGMGLGEKIIRLNKALASNLVWIADRNPLLQGTTINCSSIVISSPLSLGFADIDILVLGVRTEFVNEVIIEAKKGLKNNALIISINGEYTVFHEQYEGVTPVATYSPWNTDPMFRSIYAEITNHTLVDKYRCYELWQMVEQSSKLHEGALLEVGVWKGGTGALIAKKSAIHNISESVYLCDTFQGVVKAGSHDSTYKGGEHQDTSLPEVNHLLCQLGIQNHQILQGIFPDETGKKIEHLKFRFCHIDVDVYNSAKDVTEWLWPRLISSGIIIFDDYGFQSCDGVTAFVNEMRQWPGCLVIHNLNGHAVAIKV